MRPMASATTSLSSSPVAALDQDPVVLRRRFLIVACLAAVYVIWGSTYYGMRVGLESFPPFLMSGSRFLLGGVILYAFLRLRGAPAPSARAWGASAITGGLLFGIGNGAVAFAQQWISSSLAAIVVCTMPLWAALIARFFGQMPGRWEIAGLVLGFLGVIVLNADGQLTATNPLALVILLAPPAWALGSLWGKRLPLPDGNMAVATQMI